MPPLRRNGKGRPTGVGAAGRFRFGSFKQGVCREKCLHAGAVFQYNTSKMDGRRTRPGRPFYLGARSKRRRFYF
ncbi:hypothetical protein I656_04023 [Geobacillus sp. WSUCF1]|nr:hypothetical protein I656_04023 [Geobacillus sp. WSUCF1]